MQQILRIDRIICKTKARKFY